MRSIMRTSLMRVPLVAAATLAGVLVLLAGCSSKTSGSAGGGNLSTVPAVTSPTTPAPTVTVTATATATSGNTTQPSSVPSCASRDLQASPGIAQGTAGSTYQVIVFKNISGRTCTLFGYPGVSQAGGTPVKQIGAAADEDSATPRTLVTLAAGASGSALLRIVHAGNFTTAACDPVTATYLQIYPPNQSTPIYMAFTSQACAHSSVHLLTVDTVRLGTGS
jgi:hypothetical protein